MLEILRVVATDCDEHQRFVVGGVEQVPRGLWRLSPDRMVHWPKGTTLERLHDGAPRPGVTRIERAYGDKIAVSDRWGHTRLFEACLVTVQSWLLTTYMQCEESLFSPKLWMALDRTRYMQSSKTFVMTDRPFWKEKDPKTGRDAMSMTLTDRLTRGTYLFDNGDDRPGVICLSYSWMSDALKMLPLPVDKRVRLCLDALKKIYPHLDLESHIIGDPITVSWEADPNFLGAFKGALPVITATTIVCTATSGRRRCHPPSGGSSSRATTCHGPPAGSRSGPDGAQRRLGHHASPRRRVTA